MANVPLSAVQVLRGRVRDVLLLTAALSVPAALLSWIDETRPDNASRFVGEVSGFGGTVIGEVAQAALVVVLVGALVGSNRGMRMVLRRALEALPSVFGAYLLIALVLAVAFVVPAVLFRKAFTGPIVSASLYALLFVTAPLSLAVPVIVEEDRGPLPALERAWAMGNGHRVLAYALLGGLVVATTLLRLAADSLLPTAAAEAHLAIAVVQPAILASLLAYLYVRLGAAANAGTTSPARMAAGS